MGKGLITTDGNSVNGYPETAVVGGGRRDQEASEFVTQRDSSSVKTFAQQNNGADLGVTLVQLQAPPVAGYSLSQSYRIQHLQFQLGFIPEIIVKTTPLSTTKDSN